MVERLHPVAWLPEQWREELARRGEPRYRADQVFQWIHRRGVMGPEKMTNLPKALRAGLAEDGWVDPLSVVDSHESADGARKLVAQLHDGARVEMVLLPDGSPAAEVDADVAAASTGDEVSAGPKTAGSRQSGAKRTRVTQCISTQVGCAMGCAVCASGKAGLTRHLGPEEIVGQVLAGRAALRPDETLHNVLFMGMGEPLHNYDGTARAIRLLIHKDGLGLSPRRITVSTCGLTPKIDRLADDFEGRIGLAVSIHGGNDRVRTALCPVGRRYPLADLARALRRYARGARRPVTVEYTMVEGRNDSVAQARELARLLSGIAVKVNLIPLNTIASSDLAPPTNERMSAFQRVIIDAGHLCFIRTRRGDDVSAACGQLALSRQPCPGREGGLPSA